MTYEGGEIVVVPFPFTDRLSHKRRPALILSSEKWFNTPAGNCVMAMITSHKPGKPAWPLDVPLTHLASTGLKLPSLVRFKLFTLDNRLIVRRLGRLGGGDSAVIHRTMERWLFQ